MTQITRWAELLDYPLGTVFVDNMGDTQMLDRIAPYGMPFLVSPETRSMPADKVFAAYGPLELVYVPNEWGME